MRGRFKIGQKIGKPSGKAAGKPEQLRNALIPTVSGVKMQLVNRQSGKPSGKVPTRCRQGVNSQLTADKEYKE